MFLLAKDMSPPNPSLLLLEMVEFGELLRESPSPSDSPGSLRLLGRNGRAALKKLSKDINHGSYTQKRIKYMIYEYGNLSSIQTTSQHSTTKDSRPPWMERLIWHAGFWENISWFGQRAHLNDDYAFIQVMNKFNTLVAIEVLVESRGVWLHLLFCIRVILWGEAVLRLKVWVIILLLFVCWVHQACVSCRSEERLTGQSGDRVL